MILKSKYLLRCVSLVLPLLLLLYGYGMEVTVMRMDVSAGGGPDPTFFGLFLVAPVCLLSVALIPCGLTFLFFKKLRFAGVLLIIVGLGSCGGTGMGIKKAMAVRMDAFQRMGERLTPLVKAIEEYKQDQGEYPEDLESLVPSYIPELPATGMANYPEYTYIVGQEATEYDGNPWVIVVYAGFGMGFDTFMYFPLQNYPDSGYGGALERLGEWAYVHE
jgi:hypothetical protein